MVSMKKSQLETSVDLIRTCRISREGSVTVVPPPEKLGPSCTSVSDPVSSVTRYVTGTPKPFIRKKLTLLAVAANVTVMTAKQPGQLKADELPYTIVLSGAWKNPAAEITWPPLTVTPDMVKGGCTPVKNGPAGSPSNVTTLLD